jgi:hypothetical protein
VTPKIPIRCARGDALIAAKTFATGGVAGSSGGSGGAKNVTLAADRYNFWHRVAAVRDGDVASQFIDAEGLNWL